MLNLKIFIFLIIETKLAKSKVTIIIAIIIKTQNNKN